MSDIFIYVAAAGIILRDRESQGRTCLNLRKIHRINSETKTSLGFIGTAIPRVIALNGEVQ